MRHRPPPRRLPDLSRRPVLSVGAWSIPVIALAAAAPTAAASGGGDPTPTLQWPPASVTVSQARATPAPGLPLSGY